MTQEEEKLPYSLCLIQKQSSGSKMLLSSPAIASKVSIAFPSLPTPKIVKPSTFPVTNDGSISHPRVPSFMASTSPKFLSNSLSGDSGVSVDVDVPFPDDYSELLDQARKAAELALKDNRQLMEIEFPTAGLDSVPGVGEGGTEMTGRMQLIREFCDRFISPEKATRTRIIFTLKKKISFSQRQLKLNLQGNQYLEEAPLSWTI